MSSKKCTIAMLICIGTASIFSTCKKGGILGCHESFAYTIDAPSLAGVHPTLLNKYYLSQICRTSLNMRVKEKVIKHLMKFISGHR